MRRGRGDGQAGRARRATIDHADGRFRVTAGEAAAEAPALVIATGGPSIPKTGRDRLRLRPRPPLRPEGRRAAPGAGAADARRRAKCCSASCPASPAEVVASCGKASFREAALFTHRGLSGPAILQISSYWRHGEEIAIDFLPDAPRGWLRRRQARAAASARLKTVLGELLPARLADTLTDRLGLDGELGNIPDQRLDEAERRLADWRFRPNGSEGFAKAEVTAGGIATAELSSQTMEAKQRPRPLRDRRGGRRHRLARRL